MPSFIYVLHFDVPLAHAKHYTGCTENLRARLRTHALGGGSCLTRELHRLGIEWRLATLYSTSHREMRRVERTVKNMANGPRYCLLCNKESLPKMPNCVTYDVDLLTFPTTSQLIKAEAAFKPGGERSTRFTGPDELKRVCDLMILLQKKEKDALGFVPAGGNETTGLDRLITQGTICVASNGTIDVGYCAYTQNFEKDRVRIHQCVVADDARGLGHGRDMVEAIANRYNDNRIDCHVRYDLAANHFWTALGFKLEDSKLHATSGNLLNHYVRTAR